MGIDLAYLEATMQNLATQERAAQQMLDKVAGARLLCEAMLAKVREDEYSEDPDNPSGHESLEEGGED